MPTASEMLQQYRGPIPYDPKGFEKDEYGPGLQQPAIDPIMLLTSVLGPSVIKGLVSSVEGMSDQAPRMMASEVGSLFPKGYAEEKYATSLPVKAYTEPGVPFYDEIKGMNKGHALWRAKDNWAGSEVQPTGISPHNFYKAQNIMDTIKRLLEEVRTLKKGT